MYLSSQTRTIHNSDMCNSIHNKEGNKPHDKKKQSCSHNMHITKPILEGRTQMYIFPFIISFLATQKDSGCIIPVAGDMTGVLKYKS